MLFRQSQIPMQNCSYVRDGRSDSLIATVKVVIGDKPILTDERFTEEISLPFDDATVMVAPVEDLLFFLVCER
ncbi:hypothetical protein CVT30_29535 [Streptomyces sp. AMCC400023]|nr:hypothetical protein CVT30_29535 [Streptomyces sp. AMCC400023]